MECELCGKVVENPRKVSVDGSAILNVCDNCVHFGKEVQFSRPQAQKQAQGGTAGGGAQSFSAPQKVRMPYTSDAGEGEEYELVEDFGKIIQRKWQQSGKKLEEFAAGLSEKSSVVSKLISGTMIPDEKLVKKLEKALNVKLREQVSEP